LGRIAAELALVPLGKMVPAEPAVALQIKDSKPEPARLRGAIQYRNA
jgi:hypothetical protein